MGHFTFEEIPEAVYDAAKFLDDNGIAFVLSTDWGQCGKTRIF